MISHIESEVIDFLKSEKPQVLVLKGQWGTGKTYAWQKWLKRASEETEGIALNQYSYVSLFGCNSLDELKSQIFEELTPCSMIAGGVSLQTVSANVKSASEKKNWHQLPGLLSRLTKISSSIPFIKNYSVDIWRLGWLTTKEALVCIDDIERHGEGLDIKDVYGLISVLKEQKSSKVILILNDQSIEDEHKKVYEDYREKVVDIELHFDPNTDDLVQLVFAPTERNFDTISSCIHALSVKNIRTIQKIKRHLDVLKPHLTEVPDIYYKNIINSTVLFTVLYFSKPKDWPDLDMILASNAEKFAMVEYALGKEDAKVQGVGAAWATKMNLLRLNYKWVGADETDQVIGALVKQGYLRAEELNKVLEKAAEDTQEIEAKEEARSLHTKVGDLLHGTLGNNLEEVIDSMKKSLEASTKMYPSISHLNQYVSILRRLDENQKADNLIEEYIGWTERKNSHFLDIDQVETHFSGTLDEVLKKRIQEAFKDARKREVDTLVKSIDRKDKIHEAVEKCSKSILSREDFELLASFNSKDFYNYFKTTEINRSVHHFIETFLNGPGHYKKFQMEYDVIRDHLIPVIKALGSETKLNQFRLKPHLDAIDSMEEIRTAKKC